jgi:hypothetical protein
MRREEGSSSARKDLPVSGTSVSCALPHEFLFGTQPKFLLTGHHYCDPYGFTQRGAQPEFLLRIE